MPRRRTNTDRGRLVFFLRPPAYRTIKLASRGGECESVVYQIDTRSACGPFAFNRRELLVDVDVAQQLLELPKVVVGCCAFGWRLRGGLWHG